MRRLKALSRALDLFFKAARINPVLSSIERSRRFGETKRELRQALTTQTSQLLRTDILKDISQRISKQEEPIFTERDEIEIREAVDRKFKPLSKFLSLTFLMEFYYWLSNKGGQNFLDKVGIRREFDLKDRELIEGLRAREDLLIQSVDNTTKDWLARRIVEGKKARLTDREIANEIRLRVPETYKYRSEAIVRTETAEIVNRMEYEAAVQNDATKKRWTVAGMNTCEICYANEAEGWVGMDFVFLSGHTRPTAHPYCACLLDYQILPGGRVWDGE